MDKQTELDRISKRMPYSVPDNFFNELESEIAGRVGLKTQSKKRVQPRRRLWWMGGSVAAAAAIALVVIMNSPAEVQTVAEKQTPTLLAKVDSTPVTKLADNRSAKVIAEEKEIDALYEQLSDEDQEFLAEIYQNDCFMDDLVW